MLFVAYREEIPEKGIMENLARVVRSTGGSWEASDSYLSRLIQGAAMVEEKNGIPPSFRSREQVPFWLIRETSGRIRVDTSISNTVV